MQQWDQRLSTHHVHALMALSTDPVKMNSSPVWWWRAQANPHTPSSWADRQTDRQTHTQSEQYSHTECMRIKGSKWNTITWLYSVMFKLLVNSNHAAACWALAYALYHWDHHLALRFLILLSIFNVHMHQGTAGVDDVPFSFLHATLYWRKKRWVSIMRLAIHIHSP